MATMYLARDLKHEREVALKVLREGLPASMGVARFLREIKIAAQLQHPHILPLLDSDRNRTAADRDIVRAAALWRHALRRWSHPGAQFGHPVVDHLHARLVPVLAQHHEP